MQKLSLAALKELQAPVLTDEELIVLKGGDGDEGDEGIVTDDLIGF